MTVVDRLAETLTWLCAIPSLTGEEGPLCDALVERLSAVPLAEPLRRHGNSLVVPVSRQSGGPRVGLVGHLDVVRATHDGPVRRDGDRLFGPGASDMKAGLALALDLVEHELALCRGTDLTLVLYAREEGPYADNELGAVLAAEPALGSLDLAVCLEPSDNRLSLGACGSLHAAVTFLGRAAHSARPWQGENAIHKAAPLLSDIAGRPPRIVRLDGLEYRTVTTVTLAAGGHSRNSVPERFTINVNHRFAPDQTLTQAERELLDLVAGRAEVEWVDRCPGARPAASHPLVEALRNAGVAGVEAKQAWTDVARFAELGVTAVNFGPGLAAQAHQRNECASLTQLGAGRTILARWLAAIGAR